MLRLAFAGTFAARLEPQVRAQLGVPCDVVCDDESGIVGRLADIDVLVSMGFTAAMGRAARQLKLVQVPGAGLDRIERNALPVGTWLANAYGHEAGIAEFVIGAMLALTRDYARLDAGLRRGDWLSQWALGRPMPPPAVELAGKTLGILGHGRIGAAVAKRARGFDMTVLGHRRSTAPAEDGVALLHGRDGLDELLRRSDVLVVAAALTPETRGLLGERELRLLRPSALLINIARAEIIDPTALYRALAERRLAAAALDVWYRYPAAPGPVLPAEQPFHELPNVLMTPHVSGWTEGMLEARARLIAENVGRVARGIPPLNQIAVTE
jgi:phosphoglycerate dehydrogenase-like enzyme